MADELTNIPPAQMAQQQAAVPAALLLQTN
jgi:hypothetical protein